MVAASQQTANQIRDLERQLEEQLRRDDRILRRSDDQKVDGRESAETFIEPPYPKIARQNTRRWKKSEKFPIDENRYFQNYKDTWDNDLKYLVLDYQKTLNNCGQPVSIGPNGQPRMNFQSMQDPTFRGLSNLWSRYDRGRSSLEPLPGPGDPDTSKSPGKSPADKKKNRLDGDEEPTLLDKARETEQEALKSLINMKQSRLKIRDSKFYYIMVFRTEEVW